MVLNVTQGEGAEQRKAQRHVEGLLQGCSPREHRGFQRDPHVWVLGIWDTATKELEEGWESLLGLVGDAQDEGDGAWGGRGGRVRVQTVCISTKKINN